MLSVAVRVKKKVTYIYMISGPTMMSVYSMIRETVQQDYSLPVVAVKESP